MRHSSCQGDITVHFDLLPKGNRNEGAIREYERAENLRLRRWLIRLGLVLPLLGLLAWLFLRAR